MFERYTDRARRVVVLAQEIVRELKHDQIDSEHILLACSREEAGVAARALKDLEINYDHMVQRLLEKQPEGEKEPTGHIPFTSIAKRDLELSLREALQLGHNYIGTEHILLGLVRNENILYLLGDVNAGAVRTQVVQILSGYVKINDGVDPDWTTTDLIVSTPDYPDGIRVAGDLEKCWEHVENILLPGRRDRIKWEAAKELNSGR